MAFTGPREYIIERWVGQRVEAAFVLPNVYSYEWRPMPALSREWTAAKRPVKQSAGYREGTITLQGVSGVNPTGLLQIDTPGLQSGELTTGGAIDGVKYFEALLAFLAQYEEAAAAYRSVWVQNNERAPTMVFRALAEGEAFYVDDIQPVQSSRVGSSRFSYEYTLTAKSEGIADAQPYSILANTPTQSIPLTETNLAQVAAAAQYPVDADGNVIIPDGALSTSLPVLSIVATLDQLPQDMAFYRPPVQDLLNSLTSFNAAAITAIRAGLGIPRDLARNARAFCDTCANSLYDLWDATHAPLRDRARAVLDEFNAGLENLGLAANQLLGAAGAKLGGTQEAQITTLSGNNSAGGSPVVVMERILATEDLLAFAARVLGDSSRWIEIAALNDMPSPWALSNGLPLIPGTPLLVPMTLPTSFERLPDSLPTDIMGTDLLWDFQAQDFVTQGDNPQDFVDVTGLPNLKQGLLTRFTTIQGANQVRPQMGLLDTMGKATSPGLAALKASQFVTQAKADQRIRRVLKVNFSANANIWAATAQIEPISGANFGMVAQVP